MEQELTIGTAEIDITPSVGTPLCGSFSPRESKGTEDPLLVKAMVLESGGKKLAYVILDLIALSREYADQGIALASKQTGIPTDQIVCAATHTHTDPYAGYTFGFESGLVDEEWLSMVPRKLAEAVALRKELEIMRKQGVTEQETVLQAWQIGEVAFASLPGELFVQWGIKIKEESPFPWTYPVELGGDYLGYLATHQAWKAGRDESMIARSARPSPEGVEMMVDEALHMLEELWERYTRKKG